MNMNSIVNVKYINMKITHTHIYIYLFYKQLQVHKYIYMYTYINFVLLKKNIYITNQQDGDVSKQIFWGPTTGI